MKTFKTIKRFLFCLMSFLMPLFGFSQWQTPPTTGIAASEFGQIWPGGSGTNPTHSIGIGDFNGSAAYPNSLLHINGNYMTLPGNSTITTLGEVFRTDAPNTSGIVTYWRMLHGGTQVFNINNPDGSNNVSLGTTQSGHLNFFANNTQYMTILGNTNPGFVGIGLTSPNYLLDISGGDININSAAKGLRLNSQYILWHNNNTSNLMVGVNAGNSSSFANCTYVGYGAGSSSASFSENNAFFGTNAGTSNTGGESVMLGTNAGFSNTTGNSQCFLGTNTGYNTTTGGNNIFLGPGAGYNNTTGSNNCYVGLITGPPSGIGGLTNSAGFGNSVSVRNSNNLILGNTTQFSGFGLSNEATGPQTTLEILARDNSGTALADESGLRFRQLTSASTAGPSSNVVLSVDGDGDVILVDATAASGITADNGLNMSTASNVQLGGTLIQDTDVDISDYHLSFSGQTNTGSSVSIGTTTSSGKLFINDVNKGIGIRITENTPSNWWNYGEFVYCTGGINNTGLNLNTFGVYPGGNFSERSIGVLSRAYFAQTINLAPYTEFIGARLQGFGISTQYPLFGFGVQAEGRNSSRYLFGGHFRAIGPSTTSMKIGVYATALNCFTPGECGEGPLGPILTSAPDFAGFFVGDLFYSGNLLGPSDSILKTNISSIPDATSLLIQLSPKKYSFKRNDFPFLNLPDSTRFGFLAQDVEGIFPQYIAQTIQPPTYDYPDDSTVTLIDSGLTFKSINTTEFTPLLVKGFQEHNGRIDSLEVLPNVPHCSKNATLEDNAGYTLGSSNFYFDAALDTGGNIGIGYACGDSLSARLDVFQRRNPVGIHVNNDFASFSSSPAPIGVYSISRAGDFQIGLQGVAENGARQMAVRGDAVEDGNNSSAASQFGGYFTSQSVSTGIANHGVLTTASGEDSDNYGVHSIASGTDSHNYGGFFSATGGGHNIGVYGSTTGDTTIGNNNWAGYFEGSVYATNTYNTSDASLKTNFQTVNNADDIISGLNPQYYSFVPTDGMNLPDGIQAGFTAQELESVLPNAVKTVERPAIKDEAGNIVAPAASFKAINYQYLIPILVASAKSQKEINDAQNAQIEALQNQLNSCCANDESLFRMSGGEEQTTKLSLSSTEEFILYQNKPNPFSNATTIRYYIPERTNEAFISFVDEFGREIKREKISSGYGKVEVESEKLASGIYTYHLLVGSDVKAVRKMVKAR